MAAQEKPNAAKQPGKKPKPPGVPPRFGKKNKWKQSKSRPRPPLANLQLWKKTGLVFIAGCKEFECGWCMERRTHMTKNPNGNGDGANSGPH